MPLPELALNARVAYLAGVGYANGTVVRFRDDVEVKDGQWGVHWDDDVQAWHRPDELQVLYPEAVPSRVLAPVADHSALVAEGRTFLDPGLVIDNGYRPNDQEIRIRHWNWAARGLKEPGREGWADFDEDVKAWELGHGHDVRLKCAPEYGCFAIELYAHNLISRLLDALDPR